MLAVGEKCTVTAGSLDSKWGCALSRANGSWLHHIQMRHSQSGICNCIVGSVVDFQTAFHKIHILCSSLSLPSSFTCFLLTIIFQKIGITMCFNQI